MALFTEKMKTLTDEVAAFAKARGDALAGVSEHTERLLSDARSFLNRLGQEHRALATHIRATLSASRNDRTEQVRSMRQDFCTRLQEMRDRLHESLKENRNRRQEKLGQMFDGFRQVRRGLADDLREAGRTWRHRVRS